jgi:general secretion pathway protein L
VFSAVRQGLTWFIDGLADAWTGLASALWRRSRVALVPTADGYAIETPDNRQGSELLQIEDADGGFRFAPSALAATLKNADVDIVPPPDEILIRTLDPLPGESRQYLDSIVRHQLERLTPWRTEDVLHAFRIAADERSSDRVVVTIFATSRSFNARILGALQALSPREVRLRFQDALGEEIAIPVDRGEAAAARSAGLRRRTIAAVSALTLAIVAGTAWLGWTLYRTEQELAAVTRAVAQQRRELMATRGTAPVSASDLKVIVDRRGSTPFLVLSLEALSAALPDDTWLSELRIAEGRVRMTGVSQNVPTLVPLIEASTAFSEATFFAPTTRLPNGEGDRFHLEARLMPFSGPKR